MYYVIIDNELKEYSNNRDNLLYPMFAQELENEDFSTFDTNKYKVENGILTDITSTEEYKTKIQNEEAEKKKKDLQNQIEELDKKRVRAIAEPEVKDSTTGETWLEYYTAEVKDLRTQLSSL